ncbi:MAG TPA: ABC transporter permease [Longimicrobiales bacterium]
MTTVRIASALYRRALILLPREFRLEFGEELVQCFDRLAVEARTGRGRVAVAQTLLASLVDLATRAPREHLAAARAGALAAGGWGGWWLDVRHAARRLARRPSFALASVLVLALGIAAATSVFTLVHGVVLSPLPYPDADELVVVDHGGHGIGFSQGLGITYGVYRFYGERARGAAGLAMFGNWTPTLTGAGEPVQLKVVRATPTLADVLRVRPALGRWFTAEEAQRGDFGAAVLSDRLWRERFGADPGIVGRMITLEGWPVQVVGVMPRGFAFPDARTDLWVARHVPPTGLGSWNDQAIARLAPGRTPADLQRELEALLPILRETSDDPARARMYFEEAKIFPRVVALKDEVVGSVRATLWILLGAVGVALVIAVANIANLFLVRGEERQRETAMRAALGAGRIRLARMWAAEALLLSLAAGVLGVAGAAVGVDLLKRYAPVNVPRLDEVGLHGPSLAVALGLSISAALLIGLVPALRRGGALATALREGGRSTTTGRRRLRGRNILVAAQVALALVLLIGSGLLFRTFRELRAVDLGFSERKALTFEIGLPVMRYDSWARAKAFHDALRERLAALPGVESVGAIATCLPLSGNMCWGEALRVEGRPPAEGEVPPVTEARAVVGDYFNAIGIRVRGRGLTPDDGDHGQRVAVISEATAEAYFPGEDPLGKRVSFGGTGPDDWFTIVGVAENVKSRVATDDFQRLIYLPATAQHKPGPPPHQMIYVLKSAVEPESLIPAVRAAVRDLDDGLPLARVRTLEALIAEATAPTAFALTLIGLAALISLLLGAVGVYAVVAYAVSRRTGEIGVRMALGGRAADVHWLVLRQGGAVVAAGVAIGLAGALALTRVMRGLLFGVSPTDPATFAALTGMLAAVAAAALWLPARRASRVDSAVALRHE